MADYVSDLKLGERLGKGAFGEVFCGEDPAHGKVAVKLLKRDQFVDNTKWQNFKAGCLGEAKNLAKASHPNVVKVHHVVEARDGDSVAICMEFCPGGSLQQTFETGPMTLSAVRKVGTEILMGLGVIHSRGMIHRDIKPANILWNDQCVAQISDFGLVTDDLVLGYASQAGYVDHIAYEVWNGKGCSVRSDIWAVGMTLYRLLHGQLWYGERPRPSDIVKNGGFAETLSWLPHIPKAWRRVIRKMLNDDSSARYQCAAEALNGLAKLPITPTWQTTVENDLVCWEQIKGNRRIVVEWERISPRRYEWRAWSEPLGVGQNKRLSGPDKAVSCADAIKGLMAFFDA